MKPLIKGSTILLILLFANCGQENTKNFSESSLSDLKLSNLKFRIEEVPISESQAKFTIGVQGKEYEDLKLKYETDTLRFPIADVSYALGFQFKDTTFYDDRGILIIMNSIIDKNQRLTDKVKLPPQQLTQPQLDHLLSLVNDIDTYYFGLMNGGLIFVAKYGFLFFNVNDEVVGYLTYSGYAIDCNPRIPRIGGYFNEQGIREMDSLISEIKANN